MRIATGSWWSMVERAETTYTQIRAHETSPANAPRRTCRRASSQHSGILAMLNPGFCLALVAGAILGKAQSSTVGSSSGGSRLGRQIAIHISAFRTCVRVGARCLVHV